MWGLVEIVLVMWRIMASCRLMYLLRGGSLVLRLR